MKTYDVFVIGTGTAGQLVATQCANSGKKVGVIDIREYGGTCAQRGCDPKKILLAAIEAQNLSGDLKGNGVSRTATASWEQMLDQVESYRDNIPQRTENKFKEAGIDCYHGNSSFVDKNTLDIEGEKIYSKKFVIATGMKTRPLDIPGAEYTLSSGDFFSMKQLPKKVLFIGGGYIGMEFGHILHRLGCEVTVLQRGERILNPFEEYTVHHAQQLSIELGISIQLNSQASSIEKIDDKHIVYYHQDGVQHQKTVDVVFNTSGRVPSIDDLKLENAGVVTNRNGIVVNSKLQSESQENFYACGDVSIKTLPLTPLSGIEAQVVSENILGNNKELKVPAIPSAVFMIPTIAGIGLTEKQAKEKGLNYEVIENDASSWFNNRRLQGIKYAYKILLDKSNNEIVGAHIIGPEASEQINMFAVAMNAEMTFENLKNTIFTYPSWGNDIRSF